MKRRVLITGATSGIGEATAWAFADAGYDLLLTGRRSERLKALKSELMENFEVSVALLCFDVRDRVATEAALGSLPEECRRLNGTVFDPSHPAVLDYVRRCTEMVVDWGYELIKHDFSTCDIFDRWGFDTIDFLARDGWHFYDRTKTSAEITMNFYRVILQSAGKTKILGCNCIGHLCAGLVHANRTGDDTSGVEWERTRKMGVNTLAFRLPQQGAFFGADADCVGIKGLFPWENNRQWLDLLARSASPLFVSCDPAVVTEEQKQDLTAAYALWNECMDKGDAYALRPVDWMETTTPRLYAWKDENGEHRVEYSWLEAEGKSELQL